MGLCVLVILAFLGGTLSISQIDLAAATQTKFTHTDKSIHCSRQLWGILCRRWNLTVWPVWLEPVCFQSF